MTSRARGQIHVLFALFLLALLLTLGGAIDLAGVVAEEARLQNAVDSAALAASQTLGQNRTLPGATAFAKAEATSVRYLSENGFTNGGNVSITVAAPTPTPGGPGGPSQNIEISVQEQYSTPFWGLIGRSSTTLLGRASANQPGSMLDVILTVDETGSMTSADMNQLKAAARRFLDDLAPDATDPYSPRIGIAQFQGLRYYARWSDSGTRYGYLSDATILSHLSSNRATLQRIIDNTGTGTCPTRVPDLQPPLPFGAAPSPARWSEFSVPYAWWIHGTAFTQLPLRSNSTAPAFTEPTTSFGCALNTNASGSGTYIRNGVTVAYARPLPGSTRQPWDMWAQTPAANGGARPTARKVLILMTDGDNTTSQPDPSYTTQYLTSWNDTEPDLDDLARANQQSRDAAADAKAAGIEVYTIGFFDSAAPACPAPSASAPALSGTHLLLNQMSSSSPGSCDHYYPLLKTQSLPDVFSAIAGRLKRARLLT